MMITSKGEKLEIGDIVMVDGVLKGEIVSAEGKCGSPSLGSCAKKQHFTIRDRQGILHVIEPWWIVSKWVECTCGSDTCPNPKKQP